MPRNPRPCAECGHPEPDHRFRSCWRCRADEGFHRYRKAPRQEPLRAKRAVWESELARRLRKQYGPPLAMLQWRATGFLLDQAEKATGAIKVPAPETLDVFVSPKEPSVALPRLDSGRYRLRSEVVDPASGLVRLRLERQPDPKPKYEEPAVTGDQLLEEIDSLARARRGDVPKTCGWRNYEGPDLPPMPCSQPVGHTTPHDGTIWPTLRGRLGKEIRGDGAGNETVELRLEGCAHHLAGQDVVVVQAGGPQVRTWKAEI